MMPTRSVQLFCFPYAGASAAPYLKWRRRLPSWIEVVAVDPPGHGRRMSEPLETTITGLIDRVMGEVRLSPGRPFALFGHSLGALVAFEVAFRLRISRAPEPLIVFASGAHAPSQRSRDRFSHLSTDESLRDELIALQGTPRSVLADPELMALTLPILRADFQAAASYRCTPGRRICAPIQAIGGLDDLTTHETLDAWRSHTEGNFYLNMFPGGHFFIHDVESELLSLIESRLDVGREPWQPPLEAPTPPRVDRLEAHGHGSTSDY